MWAQQRCFKRRSLDGCDGGVPAVGAVNDRLERQIVVAFAHKGTDERPVAKQRKISERRTNASERAAKGH